MNNRDASNNRAHTPAVDASGMSRTGDKSTWNWATLSNRCQAIERLVCATAILLLFASSAAGTEETVRLAVEKRRVTAGNPPALLFLPISSPAIAAAGFSPLADYATRTVYEGPASAADSLRASLQQAGHQSSVASDLDHVALHGFQIDPDAGTITPVPAGGYTPVGSDGLYVLVLRTYPLDSWLDDLAKRNVRRLTELPPAGYVVRCARTTAATLAHLPYVRSVFPLPPDVKLVGFNIPSPDPSPYRRVVIEAAVETPAESLQPFLHSVSRDGVVFESVSARTTRYEALLTPLDAATLAQFETVYSVAAAGLPTPSSERQAQLLAQSGQEATLPATNTDYNAFLISKRIFSAADTFDNTRVGVIDTGFDTGAVDYANIHPDFRFTFGAQQITTVIEPQSLWSFPDDRDYHGTIVTSIITGYPGPLPDHADAGNYRYGLGIAPTVRCVPYKAFQCSGTPSNFSIQQAVQTLAGHGTSVINMSFNDRGNSLYGPDQHGCGYGTGSKETDQATRDYGVLAVVAAGNLPQGCSNNYVRTPATARNAVAVGSTDNFTLDYGDGGSDMCDWDRFPPSLLPPVPQDATRIPDYSARGYPTLGGFTTVVKPDLVAPSTRVTGPLSRSINICSGANGILCNSSVDPPDGLYAMSAGTSFAAAAVSGAAAVVRKWHKNLLGGDPSPAMTKAILINGARDIGGPPTTLTPRDPCPAILPDPTCPAASVRSRCYVEMACVGHIPDPDQGWGMVSFDRLLGDVGGYYFYDQGLQLSPSLGGLWQKYLHTVDGARNIRVTLVWTDPAGNEKIPAPPADSVPPDPATNNLDLSVTNAGGTITWYGNQLDQQGTGYSVANPVPPHPDAVNNVEQVIIPANTFASGAGLIVAVTGTNIPSGSQDFALFIDNATEPATTLTTMTPCRLVDTRGPVGPLGGPALSANTNRTFTVWGNCGVPVSAKSVVLNATIIDAGADGTLRLYPGGIQPPLVGVVYYSAGQQRADNSVVALGGSGTIGARADQPTGTSTNLIIDVVGYYE